MAYPTGTFTDYNVPEGTLTNMTAGQAVIFMDLRTDGSPEGEPSTCVGWCKEFKLTKDGKQLTFEQGMPQEVINSIEVGRSFKAHFKGFEWNLDLFQMQEGNEAVDESDPLSKFWGIGGEATKRKVKALAFHKLLDGRYVWVNLWKMAGDGSFVLEFPDADWFGHDYDFTLHKADEDFEGTTLTKDYYFRIEETNLPS